MRKSIYTLHVYSALVTGLILVVIAVTGCLLVFELRMDRRLDPAVSYIEPKGDPAPFGTIMEQLNAAYLRQKITEINVGEPGISVMARVSGKRVFVNPYTGRIIDSRTGEPASFHLRHLHRELAGGKMGATIVNVTTFLLLLQSLPVYIYGGP